MSYQTVVKKAFLSGTTPRIRFRIVDEDGTGFQPDTLTMSIYDQACEEPTPVGAIVNGRNDVDVLSSCDTGGQVDLYLSEADTTVAVPDQCRPTTVQRHVLFVWTWDTLIAAKKGKHQVILTIAPDRETVAS